MAGRPADSTQLISLASLLLVSWSLSNLLPFGARSPCVLPGWECPEDLGSRFLLRPNIFMLGGQLNCREAVRPFITFIELSL